MRYILILLFCFGTAYGQVGTDTVWFGKVMKMRAARIDSLLTSSITGVTITGGVDSIWRVAGKDSIFWRRNGNTFKIKDSTGGGGIVWGAITGTLSDQKDLYDSLLQRVRYNDTASMLSKYLRRTDTASLSSRINLKLNISDTSVFQRDSIGSYGIMANNTNATAPVVRFTFRQTGTLTLPDSLITWSGTTAPSGTTNHTYEWQQLGNVIHYQFILSYGTAGTSNTTVQIKKPDDMPSVKQKSGQTAANSLLGRGVGQQSATKTSTTSPTGTITSVKRNAGNTADEFVLSTAAVNTSFVIIQGSYFTD